MSFDRLDKQTVEHRYNEILLSSKKAQTTDTADNLGDSQNHEAEFSLKSSICYILYDSIYITFSKQHSDEQTGQCLPVSRLGEDVTNKERMRECLGGDGTVLYHNCGGGYTNLHI